jgi:2-dehydropantoate 2-reductase
MKACIYGAGAIGGWLGVRLARAGCDVSVVARGVTLAALGQHGLRLVQGGEPSAVPVRASASPAELGVQDLVVIAVKAPAITRALSSS